MGIEYPVFPFIFFARKVTWLAALISCHPARCHKHGDDGVRLKSSDAFSLPFSCDESLIVTGDDEERNGQC